MTEQKEDSVDKFFPITWKEWDGDPECIQFIGVTFTDRWGIYNKGDKVAVFTVMPEEGIWQTYHSPKDPTPSFEGKMKAVCVS
jgi:hypothetical protein